jgi:hypothetical protein
MTEQSQNAIFSFYIGEKSVELVNSPRIIILIENCEAKEL